MDARKTIRLYYVLTSITAFGVSFLASTYVIFLQKNHLNLLEINLVNFFFFVTIFLFEIPTGAVADIFGRKPSYVISCFLLGLSFILYGYSDCFVEFVLAEMVGAVAVTFSSGAFQAWLVDRLKHFNYEEKLGPILTRRAQIDQASCLVGALMGGVIADHNMRAPWLIGGGMQWVVGIVALVLMKEEGFKRKTFTWCRGWLSMKRTILVSRRFALRNKAVRFVMVMGLIQSFAVQGANMYWQPFFGRFLGPSTAPLGLIFVGVSLAAITGAGLTGRISRLWKSEKRGLAVVQLGIAGGVIIAAYLWTFPLALTAFLLHEAFRGMYFPLKDTYLNANIPSRRRATLLSFESMAGKVGGAVGLVVSGLLAHFISIPFAWVVSGGLLFIATLWLMKNGKA